MKTTFTNGVLVLLLSSFLGACSFLPKFGEPELGAALASYGPGDSLTVDGVLFDFQAAVLQPGAQKIVARTAKYLRDNPASTVLIEGHTDHVGDEEYNQILSEMRAGSIVSALRARGVSPDRIEAVGYGETKPIADNSTAEGRQSNRRVEIILQ